MTLNTIVQVYLACLEALFKLAIDLKFITFSQQFDRLKKIAAIKANARSAGMNFFDNITIDYLYENILKTNPDKFSQKTLALFNSENKELNDDLDRTILSPILYALDGASNVAFTDESCWYPYH